MTQLKSIQFLLEVSHQKGEKNCEACDAVAKNFVMLNIQGFPALRYIVPFDVNVELEDGNAEPHPYLVSLVPTE